eukprot:SAG31_NODE_4342_length_3337_cov_1.899012_4_plen_158_part_00
MARRPCRHIRGRLPDKVGKFEGGSAPAELGWFPYRASGVALQSTASRSIRQARCYCCTSRAGIHLQRQTRTNNRGRFRMCRTSCVKRLRTADNTNAPTACTMHNMWHTCGVVGVGPFAWRAVFTCYPVGTNQAARTLLTRNRMLLVRTFLAACAWVL